MTVRIQLQGYIKLEPHVPNVHILASTVLVQQLIAHLVDLTLPIEMEFLLVAVSLDIIIINRNKNAFNVPLHALHAHLNPPVDNWTVIILIPDYIQVVENVFHVYTLAFIAHLLQTAQHVDMVQVLEIYQDVHASLHII